MGLPAAVADRGDSSVAKAHQERAYNTHTPYYTPYGPRSSQMYARPSEGGEGDPGRRQEGWAERKRRKLPCCALAGVGVGAGWRNAVRSYTDADVEATMVMVKAMVKLKLKLKMGQGGPLVIGAEGDGERSIRMAMNWDTDTQRNSQTLADGSQTRRHTRTEQTHTAINQLTAQTHETCQKFDVPHRGLRRVQMPQIPLCPSTKAVVLEPRSGCPVKRTWVVETRLVRS